MINIKSGLKKNLNQGANNFLRNPSTSWKCIQNKLLQDDILYHDSIGKKKFMKFYPQNNIS